MVWCIEIGTKFNETLISNTANKDTWTILFLKISLRFSSDPSDYLSLLIFGCSESLESALREPFLRDAHTHCKLSFVSHFHPGKFSIFVLDNSWVDFPGSLEKPASSPVPPMQGFHLEHPSLTWLGFYNFFFFFMKHKLWLTVSSP